MSELRADPLTGEAVIISPSRDARPHSDDGGTPACPFCPGQESETPPEVLRLWRDDASSWFVRVFPNRFPIVSGAPELRLGDQAGARSVGGTHEVIVETPLHDQDMHQRTVEEVQLTLSAYRHRLNAHLATPGIRYVAVFRNRGRGAGASLEHPHSQVVALPYVPRAVLRTLRRWQGHHARTGRCLLCDAISEEREDGRRIVREQDGFLLYAPYGGIRPGELILAPSNHSAGFGSEDDSALRVMSVLLLESLMRLQSVFEDAAYNLVVQTWPQGRQADATLHWLLRIIPRRAELGGFELSTGDFVSALSPEDAAAMYRD